MSHNWNVVQPVAPPTFAATSSSTTPSTRPTTPKLTGKRMRRYIEAEVRKRPSKKKKEDRVQPLQHLQTPQQQLYPLQSMQMAGTSMSHNQNAVQPAAPPTFAATSSSTVPFTRPTTPKLTGKRMRRDIDAEVRKRPSKKKKQDLVLQRDLATIRGKDSYMCRQVKERTYKNYAATERTYEITFDSDWQGANLKDVRQEMRNMFENVLKDATTGMSGSDRGRVMLDHSSLNSPLVVPLQKLDTLNADTVMEAVENCLNSQESLTVDTSFNLNIGIIEIPKGSGSNYNPGSGGHGHRTHALSEADLFKKRTVWWNRSFDDHLCLHRAVAVALSKFWTVSDKEWRTLAGTDRSLDSMIRQRKFPRKTYEHMIEKNSQGTKWLQKFSQCLSDVAHVPTDTPGTLDTLLLYSNYFNVHFNVIDMDQGRVFVTPPNPDPQTTPNLYLVRCNNHWGTITSIQGFFYSSYFCESCRQPFK